MPVVSTRADLDRLARMPPLMMPGRRVELRLPELSEASRRRWERWLSGSAGMCGCASGAVFLMVFLLAALVGVLVGRIEISPVDLALVAAGAIFASAIGKIAGLATGWLGLQLGVRLLRGRIVDPPAATLTAPAVPGDRLD